MPNAPTNDVMKKMLAMLVNFKESSISFFQAVIFLYRILYVLFVISICNYDLAHYPLLAVC